MPLSEWRDAWSEQDRGHLLALVLEEWDGCSGCGHPRSQTTAKGASGRYTTRELLCAGCEVTAAAAKGVDYPGRLIQELQKPD